MFAPISERWFLAMICWWGGWSIGAKVCVICHVLYDSLTGLFPGWHFDEVPARWTSIIWDVSWWCTPSCAERHWTEFHGGPSLFNPVSSSEIWKMTSAIMCQVSGVELRLSETQHGLTIPAITNRAPTKYFCGLSTSLDLIRIEISRDRLQLSSPHLLLTLLVTHLGRNNVPSTAIQSQQHVLFLDSSFPPFHLAQVHGRLWSNSGIPPLGWYGCSRIGWSLGILAVRRDCLEPPTLNAVTLLQHTNSEFFFCDKANNWLICKGGAGQKSQILGRVVGYSEVDLRKNLEGALNERLSVAL